MAKYVEFDGKKIGTGTKYKLIDSGENIKKTINHYISIQKAANEIDDDDYLASIKQSGSTVDLIATAVCDLLELNAAQTKRVKNLEFSFSDEYGFFNDCLNSFLGLRLPSMDDDDSSDTDDAEEQEDPK
ncbi:hypothetical protein [Lactiplantibacillus plantarum]|uniref:hypothetical protein n=1 Tax=Lactiplantibacillus plantarum TaxID=1590 RepID=UPI00070B5BD5|nr:hypothetical protein [Lactiplantibacillus plantarum]